MNEGVIFGIVFLCTIISGFGIAFVVTETPGWRIKRLFFGGKFVLLVKENGTSRIERVWAEHGYFVETWSSPAQLHPDGRTSQPGLNWGPVAGWVAEDLVRLAQDMEQTHG